MNQQLITTHDDHALAANDQALRNNPAAVYIASLAPGSQRTMIRALNTIADILNIPKVYQERQDERSTDPNKTVQDEKTYLFVPWSEMRYQDTEAIRTELEKRLTAGGANKTLSALRQVLKRAWKLGQMSGEDYYRARDVANVTGETERAAVGRALTPGEIAALLTACANDPTPAGVRDAAIIALMYYTAIRRSSVVKLTMQNYTRESGALIFRKAKRNKTYTGNLTNGAKQYFEDWLAIRGDKPGPIFLSISQTGALVFDENGDPLPITGQAIYHLLEKRRKEAGVKKFSPHDIRRTVAGDLIDAGVDLVTVKDIMGHESINTTARYDRRPEQRKVDAVNKLHVPYIPNARRRLPGV